MQQFIACIILLTGIVGCSKSDDKSPLFQDPPADYRLRTVTSFDDKGTIVKAVTFEYDTNGNWLDSANIYDNSGLLIESAWPGPWQRPYPVKYHYNEFDLIDTITGLIPSYEPRIIFHYRIRKLEQIRTATNGMIAQKFIITNQVEDQIMVSQTSRSSAGIVEQDTQFYRFDEGRSPFPLSFRLKNHWFPVQVENYISNHNLLEISTRSGDKVEILKSHRYEYDMYGFPRIQYASDGSRIEYTYQ